MAVPEQPNQPVAEIPALEQHEDHRHQHQPSRSHRTQDGTEPRETRVVAVVIRRDDDRARRGAPGRIRRSEISLDVFDRLLQLLDRAASAGPAHVADLGADVLAVRGKIPGQMVDLARNHPARDAEHGEHQRDHDQHGRNAANPSLEGGDRRRQDECQKDGECEGHEDGLRPVEDDDDQDAPPEGHPGSHALGGVIHSLWGLRHCSDSGEGALCRPAQRCRRCPTLHIARRRTAVGLPYRRLAMTWKDKPELGLKEDAPAPGNRLRFRRHVRIRPQRRLSWAPARPRASRTGSFPCGPARQKTRSSASDRYVGRTTSEMAADRRSHCAVSLLSAFRPSEVSL